MTDIEARLRAALIHDTITTPNGSVICSQACRACASLRALAAVVREIIEDTEAELAAIVVDCKRADGALADAATVPTGNLERGIRMLTNERDTLRATLAEQAREIERLRAALKTYGLHASSCPEWAKTHRPTSLCNCGFDAALRPAPEGM